MNLIWKLAGTFSHIIQYVHVHVVVNTMRSYSITKFYLYSELTSNPIYLDMEDDQGSLGYATISEITSNKSANDSIYENFPH